MNTIPAFQSGVQAFQKAYSGAAQDTAKIASNAQTTEDLTRTLVSLESQKQQVQAAANVIQTSNDMVGTLLDIMV